MTFPRIRSGAVKVTPLPNSPVASAITRIADALLVAAALVQFAVLAYVAYLYYWTGDRQFVSGFAHAVYVGVPAIGGVLLFAALKLAPTARANLALTLCSFGLSIYAVELASTIWFSLPSVQDELNHKAVTAAAAQYGRPFDPRSKAEVIRDLRQEGQDAVPSIFPMGLLTRGNGEARSAIRSRGTEFLPLGGISRKPTVVCNEVGEHLVYVSDEHGFHNPPGLWQAGAVEVLSLGDSFVQGWCVSSDRNFVSRIRARYPITLSLGMAGNGPLTMLATLREYGTLLKPRVVLWFYFEANDLDELRFERDSPLLRRYLDDGFGQHLVARQPEIDAALRTYIDGMNPTELKLREVGDALATGNLRTLLAGTLKLATLRSHLDLVGGAANHEQASATIPSDRAQTMHDLYELFEETLDEAKQSAESWGGRLYFVYLPARTEYDPRDRRPNPDRDAVLARAASVGLPVIDVTSQMAEAGDPMQFFPFRVADHYNEAGHELVAHTVLSHLSP